MLAARSDPDVSRPDFATTQAFQRKIGLGVDPYPELLHLTPTIGRNGS
jgi:hypothetical protein